MSRFPVGGPRDAVYRHLQQRGFVMSDYSDKAWTRHDGMRIDIYGAGSMARMTRASELVKEGKIDEVLP